MFTEFSIFFFFSSGGHFVWTSGMVWAILVKGPRNIFVKLFTIWPNSSGDVV